jgi:1,6-anhydro-N-acetylmuramate kinase
LSGWTGRRFRTRFELIAHHVSLSRRGARSGAEGHERAVDCGERTGAIELSAGGDLCRLRAAHSTALRRGLRTGGLPWANDLSSGQAARYLGRRIACTWQIGDGSVLANRLQIPVVSDFRPADMAAGGLGAPLVPFLDLLLFRHPRRGRIVQNIGGIGNLTAIPAAASAEQVRAFDTGPGNMVIDALCEKLFGVAFDDRGKLAAKGSVLPARCWRSR